mmetsp:Transcript_62760/g.116695  ORF Transcript_62760/g.116695 Transcript_62760/m.116695 type:complete len:524 (+) Transcript_62760:59-1630(+)
MAEFKTHADKDFSTDLSGNAALSTQPPSSRTTAPTSSQANAPSSDGHWGRPLATGTQAALEAGLLSQMYPEDRGRPEVEIEGGKACLLTLTEVIRTLVGTASAIFAFFIVLQLCAGHRPFRELPPLVLVTLVLFCFGIYVMESRTRRVFWAASRCHGSVDVFIEKVRVLQDAEPVVELHSLGRAPEPYAIAEWRDETNRIDKESVEGILSGILLVSFPLVLLPGDEAEAKALENARAQLAAESQAAVEASETAPLRQGMTPDFVSVMMKLRLPSGLEIASAPPVVVALGDVATMVRPVLWLSFLFGAALMADLILRLCLESQEWPVRKRIYSLQGNSVGVVRFEVTPQGKAVLEGQEDSIRNANRFWLTGSQWESIMSAVQLSAPELARYRRWRRYLMWLTSITLVVALCAVCATMMARGACRELVGGAGLILTFTFALASCGADMLARHLVKERMLDLENQLGSASCSAEWVKEDDPDTLVVTIVQKAQDLPGGGQRIPTRSYVSTHAHTGTTVFLSSAYVE